MRVRWAPNLAVAAAVLLASVPAQSSRLPSSTSGRPMVSMFTTVMTDVPSASQKMVIQHNALVALAALHPRVVVTVFTNSTEGRRLCAKFGLSCSNAHTVNQHGTPVLSSMFLEVQRARPAAFYGYFNADILFDGSLPTTVAAVVDAMQAHRLGRRVLIVGQRSNFAMPAKRRPLRAHTLALGRRLAPTLRAMQGGATVYSNHALDYFLATRDAFEWTSMPNFVIGRRGYDNWIVDHAVHDGVDVVDATATLTAVHQTGVDGNKAGENRDCPDRDWNVAIVARVGGGYDHGGACDAAWVTRRRGAADGGAAPLSTVDVVQRHDPGADAECVRSKPWLQWFARDNEARYGGRG